MGLLQPHERHGGRPRQARLSRAPKAVVVHSLAQAQAALAAAASLGVPVVLMSGPGAASYAGPAWFLEVERQARRAQPQVDATAILDCADQPGRALAALRLGVKRLRLNGNPKARKRVAAIAAAMGAEIDETRYDTLDLAGLDDPEAAATAFLRDASSFETPALRAPQDEARPLSSQPLPHPEEGRRPVSKDAKRRTGRP
jgi:hypothetical protein